MQNEYKPFYTGEEVENMINKSVAKSQRRAKASWKKGFKVGTTLGVSAAVILTILISILTNNISTNIKQNKAVSEHSEEIVAMVNEEREGWYDVLENQPVTYYDTSAIAKYLVEETDNFHIALFEAYDRICATGSFSDAEVRKTMDAIISEVKSLTKDSENPINHNSWEDYVCGVNFVDKDGNADYSKYKEGMKDMITKIQSAEQMMADHGMEEPGLDETDPAMGGR